MHIKRSIEYQYVILNLMPLQQIKNIFFITGFYTLLFLYLGLPYIFIECFLTTHIKHWKPLDKDYIKKKGAGLFLTQYQLKKLQT